MDQAFHAFNHFIAYGMLTGGGQDVLVEVIDLLVKSNYAIAVVVVWHVPRAAIHARHLKTVSNCQRGKCKAIKNTNSWRGVATYAEKSYLPIAVGGCHDIKSIFSIW